MLYQHIKHTIPPVYRHDSKVLILGSFPSVKSREAAFFYGHPQNRFWRVLAAVCRCDVPITIEEKRQMLLSNGIALWDVIDECDIIGSSDSSIKNVKPNDIHTILAETGITQVFVNGKTAQRLYHQYLEHLTGIPAIYLPSTSPANAGWSFDKLADYWHDALANYL